MPGLSEERRRPLLTTVRQLRKDAEAAFADRLRAYGLFASCGSSHERHSRNCYLVPVDRLPLSEADRRLRERLEAVVEREALGYADLPPSEQTRLAVQRYQYEAAATLFNRLAAMRAMEARHLIIETVIRRPDFGGQSRREYAIARSAPGSSPHEVLAAALRAGFEEAGKHVGMLFDSGDPYALLLPEPRRLIDLLEVFGETITEVDWRADDILGWLYQYYQDEAREQFRRGRGRGARRTADADELAAINCLYTPHWVVQTLVDNTLGRLLVDHTSAAAEAVTLQCRCILQTQPTSTVPTKPLRSIRVLDPASGSGHFLIYAFDVLWCAYRAEEPDLPPEEHAAAILQHNLFGIDIDLRACQLAALGLYLKAKEHAPAMQPAAVNVVCADIRMLDGDREREFLHAFADDPQLRRIAQRLIDDLHYTAEIGSLLRVRGAFDRLFSERRAVAQRGQQRLLQAAGPPEQLQLEGIVPREKTLTEILNAVHRFERHAIERSDMGGRLFASDTERSVGLLSTLSNIYDVVLMNPPYNKRQELPPRVREYLAQWYPLTAHEISAAFVEQALALVEPGGRIGMLTPRTYAYLRNSERFRTEVLANSVVQELFLEFGLGVPESAMPRTAAAVLRVTDGEENSDMTGHYWDLTRYPGSDLKWAAWLRGLEALRSGEWDADHFERSPAMFEDIPGKPWVYWLPTPLLHLFKSHPPLDRDNARNPTAPKLADVKQGLATADDTQFTRRWWEVRGSGIGSDGSWRPFAKGEEYARWYHDPTLVVRWTDRGSVYWDAVSQTTGRPRSNIWMLGGTIDLFLRPGVTWQRVSDWPRRMRYLPQGCVFADKGPSLFPVHGDKEDFALLGLLNSSLMSLLMLALTPERGWEVGQISLLPVADQALKSQRLTRLAQELHDLHLGWDTGDEVSTRFVAPRLLQVAFPNQRIPMTGHPLAEGFEWPCWESWERVEAIRGAPNLSLGQLAELVQNRRQLLDQRIAQLERGVDDEVLRCYELEAESEMIQAALERRLGVAGDDGEDEETQPKSEPPSSEDMLIEVQYLLAHYARRAVEESEDGIVRWHPSDHAGLVACVRRLLAQEWGDDRGQRLEDEIAGLLNRTMEEWLTLDFFAFHVRLYRNRPIVWLLWSAPRARSRGRARARQPGFACFLDYHRISRDMLQLVRGRYLARAIDEARAEAERIEVRATEVRLAGDAQATALLRAAEDARALVGELMDFDGRLGALLDKPGSRPSSSAWVDTTAARVCEDGFHPDPDLGVAVNLRPMREAGLLHPAVDRVS